MLRYTNAMPKRLSLVYGPLERRRAGRESYACFLVFLILYQFLRGAIEWEKLLAFVHGDYLKANHFDSISAILGLGAFVVWGFFLRTAVRRLHDCSKSGWWVWAPLMCAALLLVFLRKIPETSMENLLFLNLLVYTPFAVLAFLKPDPGPNRYGAPQKVTQPLSATSFASRDEREREREEIVPTRLHEDATPVPCP